MEKGFTTNVLDKGYVKLVDWMGDDFTPANDARISTGTESKNEKQDETLIRYLLRHKHTSVFEGCIVKFQVCAPIMVIREWFRHRTFCLAGDTKLYFDLPNNVKKKRKGRFSKSISELHEKWHYGAQPIKNGDREIRIPMKDRISEMNLRCVNEATGEIVHTKITDIWKSGEKNLFEIELENKKKIQVSQDHLFFTEDGWKTLKEATQLEYNGLSSIKWDKQNTPKFACNGKKSFNNHVNKGWLASQREEGIGIQEIADRAGVSYHYIRKCLQKFGLQYSSKEKSILSGQSQRGQKRTFKNKPEFSDERRERLRELHSGEKSNFWKGGVSSERQRIASWQERKRKIIFEKDGYKCRICEGNEKLTLHHIDPVWNNKDKAYSEDNLTTLCKKCHAKLHALHLDLEFLRRYCGKTIKNFFDDYHVPIFLPEKPTAKGHKLVTKYSRVKSIRYVGKEETYDISVAGEWKNFIANGFVVHNSYNEESGRYKKLDPLYYLPELSRIKKQSTFNKQGSGDVLDESDSQEFRVEWLKEQEDFEFQYNYLIDDKGVANELARLNMPVSHYSTFIVTGNLLNWFRFLQLRMAEGAQWEIRQYANIIFDIVKEIYPISTTAFKDYWIDSISFSKPEIEILRYLMTGDNVMSLLETNDKMSKREKEEFMTKLNKIYNR